MHKIEELDKKVKQEKELLDKESGQLEELQSQVEDLQDGKSKLFGVLNIIQDNVGRLHEDEDNASEVDMPVVKTTIPITQPRETSRVLELKMEEYNEKI